MKVMEEASEEVSATNSDAHKVILDARSLDFRNILPSDFKNNKRVTIPDMHDDPEEIRRNNLKAELRKVVMNYKKEHCDISGNVLENNVSESELNNLKKLRTRIQKEELVCGETDKTGKFTLDTLKNMTDKMDKHVKDDKILSVKEAKRLENKLNRHMDFWSKFLKAGEKNKQMRKVKSNLVTKDSQFPILRGTSKDHKKALDELVGPDLRPIMGAIVGPNVGLSEVGSIIVRKISDNADNGSVAKSTEEVLNKFEIFNKRRLKITPKLKNLIIASMDVEKYYPNILSAQSAKIIRRMWEESDLTIEGIDIDKLVGYLSIFLTKEEIIEEAFEELLYSKVVKEKTKQKKMTKKISRKSLKKQKKNKNSGQK